QNGAGADNARLRVVSATPDAEIFLDGASVGKPPLDRRDLAPGKHFVVVRKQGFADWKREVDLQPGQQVSLTAELSASGSLKTLATIAGADVFIDGAMVGKTPLTLPDVPAGDHLVEVKRTGFLSAKQQMHLEGGEQKILSAELAEIRNGPTPQDIVRRARGAS